MFPNASNFQIHGSTFVDVAGNLNVNTGGDATAPNNSANSILEKKRMPGAEFDSSDRYPPPKCYKSTRRNIRKTVWEWLENDNRESNMFWVMGTAGVGKSAVAQTIIDEWDEKGQPGASYFFSRPNHRNDPSTVVPTLVYRLVHKDSRYKALVNQLLGEDPSIFEKDIQSQFNKLIFEPFRLLHTNKCFDHPLLIVLDGLDECDGRENQRLFADIVNKYATKSRSHSPLLWLVFSRPEWNLKGIFQDTVASCRSELSADHEARLDVHGFLRDEFQVLHRRFAREGLVSLEWPTKDQLRQLGDVASGLFVIASTTLRFVEHGTQDDPMTRLQLCIDFLTRISATKSPDGTRTENTNAFDKINPLDALDRLYREILKNSSTNDPKMKMQMMDILCLRILYPDHNLSVRLHTNILGLARPSFLSALLDVHSVLLVPPPEYMEKHGIFFHHASFADFLQDPRRSQEFYTLFNEACCNVAICCLRWYNPLIITRCSLNAGCNHTVDIPLLAWPPASGDKNDSMDAICSIVGRTVWDACCHGTIDSDSTRRLCSELRRFSFCHLELSARNGPQFVRFLSWLYEVDTRHGILRTIPFSFRDLQLASEIRFKLSLNVDSLQAEQSRIEIISRHPRKEPSKREQSGAFLLGKKKNACLIRIIPEHVAGDNLNKPEVLLEHVHTIRLLYF